MPSNVGEMFYCDEMPWHREGIALQKPATMEEALKVGGLNWDVGLVDLTTADDPPSPVARRHAIVRLDRPAGHAARVLGVAHRDFRPLQNRDGALLFDAIFGKGQAVYHTGGYLGNGEVVWLLAKLNSTLLITKDDVVEPYALFTNSHDGSIAVTISLTTVRVVCQNTLRLALDQRGLGTMFKRSHRGSFREHADAAQGFFAETMQQLSGIGAEFVRLSKVKCRDDDFADILTRLLPLPSRPRNAERNPGLVKAWEKRVEQTQAARAEIIRLRTEGQGTNLASSAGTFWGALNAITEYVDHYREVKGSRLAYALLGDGMDLKVKAYRLIQGCAGSAA
jgi:phage/plasmid-like protein (TIGR03299 family)